VSDDRESAAISVF